MVSEEPAVMTQVEDVHGAEAVPEAGLLSTVRETVLPAKVSVAVPDGYVFAVPVLERVTKHVPAAVVVWAVHAAAPPSEVEAADTFAVLLAPPNMPNTYPRIAAAAMSVAAMMRTVATIGEIAFLCCPDIFIEVRSLPVILTLQDRNY